MDKDWSHGRYEGVSGIDPEICPGRLVLENDLSDLRYVGSPTHFQGLYSMEAYHDTLFITASDYPYMFDGADVIAYDYLRNSFEVVYQPYESGLHLIKLFGDTLYLPGPDSMDPLYDPGSIYTYDGRHWQEKATLPTAVHVNDVEVVGGVVYATTGHATGELNGMGCVWRSTDWGDTFTRVLCNDPTPEIPFRRIFGAGHLGQRVFVQPDARTPDTHVVYSSVNGTDWDTIPVPHMPVDRQAMFTNWQGQLLMTMEDRLYIWDDGVWREHALPFHGWRWCRGIHGYKGELYGGGSTCRLFRWHGASQWESVGHLPVDSTTTEIESIETYFGRLYLSTSRPEQGGSQYPGIYVSAAIPLGSLVSTVHDFGTRLTNTSINWSEYRPALGHKAAIQVRSGLSPETLRQREFVGPDGTAQSYYENPDVPLAAVHDGDRYFQYRVELRCPFGLRMPVLHEVTIKGDTLVSTTGIAADEHPAEGDAAPVLELGLPYPNPARGSVTLPLSVSFRNRTGSPGPAARLRLTDVRGRVLRTEIVPIDPSGRIAWPLDLRDAEGRPLPSGSYCVKASIPGGSKPEAVRIIRVLR